MLSFNNQTPPILYSRSSDGGDTWDINVEANVTGLDETVIGMNYDTFIELYCLPEPDAATTTTTTTT